MSTMLVTGGAGFIGSNFVRHALAHTQHRVVVLDKLTYAGSLDNLADVSDDPRFTFIEGDIARGETVREIFRKHRPRWIVNFAAETHVDRSIDGPAVFIETNILGTFELLRAALDLHNDLGDDDRRAFRFLHVSTDEVYGSLGETGTFSEETAYAPNSPYAASKASADHLVRAYHSTYGLPVVITNCSNNYGPYQFPEKLIPLMTLNAAQGKPLPIYGDGLNVRDWLYVDDHCAGVLMVLEEGKIGEKYNIGGGNERTNVEVVDGICVALEELLPAGSNPALEDKGVTDYRELKTFVEDRKGHDRRYAIDADKVRRELGWKPAHDFDAGILETVRWYLDHRDWCEAVQTRARYQRERLGLSSRSGN